MIISVEFARTPTFFDLLHNMTHEELLEVGIDLTKLHISIANKLYFNLSEDEEVIRKYREIRRDPARHNLETQDLSSMTLGELRENGIDVSKMVLRLVKILLPEGSQKHEVQKLIDEIRMGTEVTVNEKGIVLTAADSGISPKKINE